MKIVITGGDAAGMSAAGQIKRQVPDDLKRRMQEIDEADMSKIAGVIGKKQKE